MHPRRQLELAVGGSPEDRSYMLGLLNVSRISDALAPPNERAIPRTQRSSFTEPQLRCNPLFVCYFSLYLQTRNRGGIMLKSNCELSISRHYSRVSIYFVPTTYLMPAVSRRSSTIFYETRGESAVHQFLCVCMSAHSLGTSLNERHV